MAELPPDGFPQLPGGRSPSQERAASPQVRRIRRGPTPSTPIFRPPPLIRPDEPPPGLDLVSALNFEWRSHYAESFSGSDKASIAQYLGVSRRSVERWITLSTERRRAFPLFLQQQDLCAWPERYVRRLFVTALLFWGLHTPLKQEDERREFVERQCNLFDTCRFALATADGSYDAWLTGQWVDMHAEKDLESGQWLLRVGYNYRAKGMYKMAKPEGRALPGEVAYPSPPVPIIPDTGPYEANVLSCPVPGFDYERGEFVGGTVHFVSG